VLNWLSTMPWRYMRLLWGIHIKFKSRALDVDESIILRWHRNRVWERGLVSSGSEQGTVAGSYVYDDKLSVSINSGDILAFQEWLFLMQLITRYRNITCVLIHIVFQCHFNTTSANNLNITSRVPWLACCNSIFPGREWKTNQCQ
jgi:hypothetical protein